MTAPLGYIFNSTMSRYRGSHFTNEETRAKSRLTNETKGWDLNLSVSVRADSDRLEVRPPEHDSRSLPPMSPEPPATLTTWGPLLFYQAVEPCLGVGE